MRNILFPQERARERQSRFSGSLSRTRCLLLVSRNACFAQRRAVITERILAHLPADISSAVLAGKCSLHFSAERESHGAALFLRMRPARRLSFLFPTTVPRAALRIIGFVRHRKAAREELAEATVPSVPSRSLRDRGGQRAALNRAIELSLYDDPIERQAGCGFSRFICSLASECARHARFLELNGP
jgi:hypothetical protein